MDDSLETDAVVDPWAVMVEIEHTLLADAAVVAPIRLDHVACPEKGRDA